jgi:nitrogen fixation/metabolism regulation signal transduction histidine kinase
VPDTKRSNYLVDRPFQFRATALIIGLTLLIGVPLGYLLYRTSGEAVAIGRKAVELGTSANAASSAAVKQSELMNTRLAMEAMVKFADKPEQLAALKKANEAETERLRQQAAVVAAEGAALAAQRDALETMRARLLTGVAGGIAALVVLVALAGIYFTHKVSGPIHRMRVLFKEVGEGTFSPYRPLRRGDELQGFFADFSSMVEQLKTRQKEEIAHLSDAIDRAAQAGVSDGSLYDLRVVRDAMNKQVEGKPSATKIEV